MRNKKQIICKYKKKVAKSEKRMERKRKYEEEKLDSIKKVKQKESQPNCDECEKTCK